MNKINPKSIQDIGTLLRRKSMQLHGSVRQFHNSDWRNKSRSVGQIKSALKTKKVYKKDNAVERLTQRQESLTRDFSRDLFLKTQFPFVEKSPNDDFSSKDLLDYEPVLNPLESNEVNINSETRDINYAEEKPNRKDLARSSAHSMTTLPQNSKLLSKFKGLEVNQSRSASTFEQNDTGSVTGNKHHDQSKYKANKKQYVSAYQKIEQSRSGRRKYSQLQDSAVSPRSKVSSKGPKGPTSSKQTMYKKNDSLSRSEQQVTMPSIFSMQSKPFPNLPVEKRFIFRRTYSTRSTSPIRRMPKVRNYTTKSTSTTPCPPLEPGVPNEPYKPPDCKDNALHENPVPRFYYRKVDRSRCNREVCTEGPPPDIARKVCTRSYSSKSGGKKGGCEEDPCKNKRKTCPNIKPRQSCADQLGENPCGEVRPKNEVCGNKPICTKPTRQDCETD